MTWKCPECGNNNDDAVAECACGYAFYKILGLKPDASEKEVKQAYRYLLKVWQTDRFSNDPLSEKKAKDRLKKINDAYDNYRNYASNLPGVKKRTRPIKIASLAAISILFLIILLVFFNISQKNKLQEQSTAQLSDKVKTRPSRLNQVNVQNIPEKPKEQSSEDSSHGKDALQQTSSSEQTGNFSADMSPEKAEERATELVKKSHAIDRFSDVETLMKKWADVNSGKFQIIGWQAKKIDDKTYLVSYTASDGLGTKGFYFDININTGTVKHIADDPELQKKYGIKYNQ